VTYTWTCSRCGELHEGLPLSWAWDNPIYWDWLNDERRAEGYNDTDFCVMTADGGDTARFVRGTIEIPIIDADGDSFVIGAWASLSEKSFDELVPLQASDEPSDAGPWFGWLANRIPVYPDTLNLPTNVHYRQGLRPVIEIGPGNHPLAQDAPGITMARALELAERWMHG
jgi:hypothetical protein